MNEDEAYELWREEQTEQLEKEIKQLYEKMQDNEYYKQSNETLIKDIIVLLEMITRTKVSIDKNGFVTIFKKEEKGKTIFI